MKQTCNIWNFHFELLPFIIFNLLASHVAMFEKKSRQCGNKPSCQKHQIEYPPSAGQRVVLCISFFREKKTGPKKTDCRATFASCGRQAEVGAADDEERVGVVTSGMEEDGGGGEGGRLATPSRPSSRSGRFQTSIIINNLTWWIIKILLANVDNMVVSWTNSADFVSLHFQQTHCLIRYTFRPFIFYWFCIITRGNLLSCLNLCTIVNS